MNDRIKAIAEQAAKWVCENEPRSMDDDELFRELSMEKFAELIVRECAYLTDTLNEAYDAPSTTGKIIKEHFGVKE